MRHRVQRAIRVAFLAATMIELLPATAADSRLSLQCKNIARDVIINSCKGPRIKRATQKFVLEKLDHELSKIGQTEALRDTETKATQRKRQFLPQPISGIQPGLLGGLGLPATNIAADTFHETELAIPGLGYLEDQHTSVIDESFVPNRPIPYQPFGTYPAIRSIKLDELLGFELSSEELEELYNEIGERMPRNSKDLNKKIFQHVAAKCCPNAKLCYDNPGLIPCMGY